MRYLKDNWKPTMRKFCKICGKKFMPTGRASKMCDKCIERRMKESHKKRFGKKNAKGKKNTRKKKM